MKIVLTKFKAVSITKTGNIKGINLINQIYPKNEIYEIKLKERQWFNPLDKNYIITYETKESLTIINSSISNYFFKNENSNEIILDSIKDNYCFVFDTINLNYKLFYKGKLIEKGNNEKKNNIINIEKKHFGYSLTDRINTNEKFKIKYYYIVNNEKIKEKSIIKGLKSKKALVRNEAAINFVNLIEEIKKILKKEIVRKENIKNNANGSLVYALSYLKCTDDFLFLFKLLTLPTYEAFTIASQILNEQDFDISNKDKKEAKNILNNFVNDNNLNYSKEEKNERILVLKSIYKYFIE